MEFEIINSNHLWSFYLKVLKICSSVLHIWTSLFSSELVNLEEENIKTDEVKKEKFFKSMNKAFKRHAMISASIEVGFIVCACVCVCVCVFLFVTLF